MYNLLIAAIAGILACVAYWADHTMVRAESKSVKTETYWKLFTGGAAIAYMTSSFVSTGSNTGTEQIASSAKDVISEIVDTIKTGQPSF
jgi:hypothetical protein